MFTQAQHAGGRSPMLYRIPKPAETTTAQHNPVRPRVLGLSQVQSQTRFQPGRLNPGSLQACLGLGYPTARLTVTQLLYDRLYTGSRLKGLLGRPKRALPRIARLLIHPICVTWKDMPALLTGTTLHTCRVISSYPQAGYSERDS